MPETSSTIPTSSNDLKKARTLIGICSIVTITIFTLVELFYYYNPPLRAKDDLTFLLALVFPLAWFRASQQIIDTDSLFYVLMVGIILIVICLCKEVLFSINHPGISISTFNLYMTALLAVFMVYFRILLYMFYPDYPRTEQKPVIVYVGKGVAWWRGKSDACLPTQRERNFSTLLFIGSILLPIGAILLL